MPTHLASGSLSFSGHNPSPDYQVVAEGQLSLSAVNPMPDYQAIGSGGLGVAGSESLTLSLLFRVFGGVSLSAVNLFPDGQADGGGEVSGLGGEAEVTLAITFSGGGVLFGSSGDGDYTIPLISGGWSFTGRAATALFREPGDCAPLPPPIEDDDACPADTYDCEESSSCKTMLYVFSRSYFRRGFEFQGFSQSGAYVPAVTICRTGLQPVPIGKLRRNPDKDTFGY